MLQNNNYVIKKDIKRMSCMGGFDDNRKGYGEKQFGRYNPAAETRPLSWKCVGVINEK